jgi:hypothetical protein
MNLELRASLQAGDSRGTRWLQPSYGIDTALPDELADGRVGESPIELVDCYTQHSNST